MFLRCAVWRPNIVDALLAGDRKIKIETKSEKEGSRGGVGGGAQKHNTALQSTKKAVFTLRLKTYEFLAPPL